MFAGRHNGRDLFSALLADLCRIPDGTHLPLTELRMCECVGEGAVMRDAQTLREHAERCRRLANSTTDRNVARIAADLGVDYQGTAQRLEPRTGTVFLSPAPRA